MFNHPFGTDLISIFYTYTSVTYVGYKVKKKKSGSKKTSFSKGQYMDLNRVVEI